MREVRGAFVVAVLVAALAVLVAVLALVVPPAGATTGTLSIVVDTTLTEDHNGRIIIGADNVTLDCAGYTITGPGRDAGVPGINLVGRSGVTVENCVLRDFNDAFRIEQQSNENTFRHNSMSHLRQGFTIQNSHDNVLIGNWVSDATDWFGYGIFNNSQGNELRANIATGVRGVGFMIAGATNNVFVDNVALNNIGNGFGANDPGTGRNTYRRNTSNNNTGTGFEDNTVDGTGDGGTDNTYVDNTCVLNGAGGSSPGGLCDENVPRCDGRLATLVGSPLSDELTGTGRGDVIAGLGGDDVIRSLGGNDIICGGDGADSVYAGDGRDYVDGGGGRDRIRGGRQADTIYGGDKGDKIWGNAGADLLYGELGNDRIIGNSGDDLLSGSNGRIDVLDGRSGTDRCSDRQSGTIRLECETG